MTKKLIALLLASVLLLGLAACGGGNDTPGETVTVSETLTQPAEDEETPPPAAEEPGEAPAEPEEEEPAPTPEPEEEEEEEFVENYDTGDASLDDPRNADEIGAQELLVVSFGTSYNDSRRLTIGAIEGALADAFPEWSVRRGFTSQIIIDHVFNRDGEVIDNVDQALDRAIANGVTDLVVQPTHLMAGYEYQDLNAQLAESADAFDHVVLGDPLLTSDEDFDRVARAIVDATAEYDDGATAIIFMGHGTEADSNYVYGRMQQVLDYMGMENYYVGTVEAVPSLQDVLKMIKDKEYTRVVLEPLMIVAGDHANNDMAGDDEDSWKSVLEAEGYEVICLIRGLGELEPVQQIFVEHAQAAMETLAKLQEAAAEEVLAEEEVPAEEPAQE